MFFFFKQKTAYEMRISDWSSDVCSSDLVHPLEIEGEVERLAHAGVGELRLAAVEEPGLHARRRAVLQHRAPDPAGIEGRPALVAGGPEPRGDLLALIVFAGEKGPGGDQNGRESCRGRMGQSVEI